VREKRGRGESIRKGKDTEEGRKKKTPKNERLSFGEGRAYGEKEKGRMYG